MANYVPLSHGSAAQLLRCQHQSARLTTSVKTLADAHRANCESATGDCCVIIQSEDVDEAIELAQKHMSELYDQNWSRAEREKLLQIG